MRLFRRRPPAPLSEMFAAFLDELAMAYDRAPGAVMDRLTAHGKALHDEDLAIVTPGNTEADYAAATTAADHTRGALLALSHTATRAVRRGIPSTTVEPRKEGS